MTFEFQTDEDTERLLNIAIHFLQEYFGYEEAQAFDLLNRYHNTRQLEDDDYHHQGPFHIAVLVHYIIGLQGDGRKFFQWRQDNGLNDTPSEASAYFREHYYKKEE